MAATVVRDRTVSVVSQEEHLVREGIGTQRPAMAEDDGFRCPSLCSKAAFRREP